MAAYVGAVLAAGRRAAGADRAGARRSSTSAAAWPARRRRSLPTPPVPAQPGARDRPPPAGPGRLPAHRRRRPLAAELVGRDAAAAGVRRRRASCSNPAGPHRRHPAAADPRRRHQRRSRCPTPSLDAGINVAEPVHQRVPPADLGDVARAAGDDPVPARRADLHAGRRAVPALAAAAAGARPRAGDHGRRRLLRRRSRRRSRSPSRRSCSRTAPTSRCCAARETFDDMIALDVMPERPPTGSSRRRRTDPRMREPSAGQRSVGARRASAISPMIRASSKSFGV